MRAFATKTGLTYHVGQQLETGVSVLLPFTHAMNARLVQCISYTVSWIIYEKQNAYTSLPTFATNNMSPDCSLALAPLSELVHPD